MSELSSETLTLSFALNWWANHSNISEQGKKDHALMAEQARALEQQIANEIESRDGWKEAWKKSEQRVERLEEECAARKQLSTAYRIGSQRMADNALTCLEALASTADE